ncbi:hypothetical protein NRB20_55690 [Nocardia sp. RB20]|uniref:Uncharacterized protein n=2 Tax=Nocardia macrotermitis TaxID=2585198 RepID=A0A7K0DC46_9NOCA|nr:hypothetical protein [Nocardia macrotermitis]
MNIHAIPVCCGLPMIRHTRPVHGTDTYVQVFRCPSCTRGRSDEIPHTAIAFDAGRDRAA